MSGPSHSFDIANGTVLVTGANGFIGTAVCRALASRGWRVRRAVREAMGPDTVQIAELSGGTDWRRALEGCDAVVHLAALAHVGTADNAAADALYVRVNADASVGLARQAAEQGLKRMLFLSSAKVQGEERERPYVETDPPQPEGPYAKSKWLAEQGITDVTLTSALDHVILRPPLVYGPGVKANFRALLGAVDRGLPLPFASVHNLRSLVGIDNLASAVVLALSTPAASNKCYLISDTDLSTPMLVEAIANALGRSAMLLPVPPEWLRMAGRLAGKSPAVERLVGSFAIDSSRIRAELDWYPVVTMQQQMEDTANWWRNGR